MKRFLTILLTCSLLTSLAQVNFSAADETATISQKGRSANFTIGNTGTETEVSTDVYAMSSNIGGNEVSMYPIISIGNKGTYAKTYLPEGMNSNDLIKLISYAKEQGFAKINSGTGAVGDNALVDAEDLDIAITAAIWGKYRYNMGGSAQYIDFDRNASSKYVKAAKYIISNYSSYTSPTTTFQVNSDNIKTIAHTDSDYRYYGPFNFTSNNSSVAIAEVSGGTKIANATWSIVDTNNLSSGTNYYIAVPVNSQNENTTVKLALQYVEKDLVVYGNTSAKFIGVVNAPFKLNETLTVSSYATAKIYDIAGNVVNVRSDDGVYDKNIVIGTNGVGYAENLSIGNYTAKQVSTADGLILNTTPKTFSITSVSDIVSVRFDTVSLYGNLQVTNTSNTGITLNGGTLNIYCTDGSLYKTITMQDVVSISMPIGNYTAVQSTAVNGYVADTANHSFTISPNKLTEIKIVNVPYGSVNDSTDAKQGNAKITVLSKKDGSVTNVYDVVLSGNGVSLKGRPIEGTVQFTGLKAGAYTVSLANTPSEYTEARAVVLLKSDDASEVLTLDTVRKPNVGERIMGIILVDENNYVIPNTSVSIYNEDRSTLVGNITTDENGYGKLNYVDKNKYIIAPNVDTTQYNRVEYNLQFSWNSSTIIKVVVPKKAGSTQTSRKLPNVVSDIVLDNYNTGVNNGVNYNDYKNDISIKRCFVVEDNGDRDCGMQIYVKDPNGKDMKDVTITVYNSKDKVVYTGETNQDGELLLCGFVPNKEYRLSLKESKLRGYYPPDDKELVFTPKSNKTTKFYVRLQEKDNQKTNQSQSSLVITTQNSSGEKLYAEYTVYNSAGVAVISGKTVNGIATFNTSEPGSYTVKQTKVQDGYVLEQDPYTFTITETPRTVTVTVTNTQSGGRTLSGVIFEDKNGNGVFDTNEGYKSGKITVSNGTKAITVYTDAAGSFKVTDLPAGTYTVQAELNGMQYIAGTDVDSNGKATITIGNTDVSNFRIGVKSVATVTENVQSTLPKTGEQHRNNAMYIGICIICLAGIFVVNRKQMQ